MFWPAKRHPALPTTCPAACRVLQGMSPGEKIWICLWGGRQWKYLRDCPIPGLTGAWGGHQCEQTLRSSSRGFGGSRQWSSEFRLHNPALNGLNTQWSLLSSKCKLRHRIIDILQMYLLQFKRFFFFSNSMQEFPIIVSWLEVDWLYSTLASLYWTKLNLLFIFYLCHDFTIPLLHKFNEVNLGIKLVRQRIFFFLAVLWLGKSFA